MTQAIQTPEPQSVLLTVEEAARLLSVGRTQIYALMNRGELRFRKIGRATRILRADIEAFATAELQGGWAAPNAPPHSEFGDSRLQVVSR